MVKAGVAAGAELPKELGPSGLVVSEHSAPVGSAGPTSFEASLAWELVQPRLPVRSEVAEVALDSPRGLN